MSKSPTKIETLQRIANVSEKKAREQLFERHPDAEIVDMTIKRIAGKDHYVTTIKLPIKRKMAGPMYPPMDGPVGEAPGGDPGLGNLDDQIGDEERHEHKPEDHEDHELDDIRKKLDILMDALGVTDPDEHGDEVAPDEDPMAPGNGDPLPPPVEDPASGPDLGHSFSSLDPKVAQEIQQFKALGKSLEAKYAQHRSAIITVDDASSFSNAAILDRMAHATAQFRVASLDRDTYRDTDRLVIALVRK